MPIDEPFQELRQEAVGELAVDERQSGQRLRRVDALDNPLDRRDLVGAGRKQIRRGQPAVAVAHDETAREIAETVGLVALVGQPLGGIEELRQAIGERLKGPGAEAGGLGRGVE